MSITYRRMVSLRGLCLGLAIVCGPAPAQVPAKAPAVDKAAAADSKTEYALAAGDTIRITVFQNADLTTDTRVSENGAITFPLIGSVRVGGMTLTEAEHFIASKLREGGFVLQPQVNVLLVQIRGNQVSALGQVNRPGRYAIETANTRITDILAMAGGATNAGSDVIVVNGMRGGKRFRKEIDIPALLLESNIEDDIVVAAGDVIYVHRAPAFYIYGEVQRPGTYRVERNMTVLQALAQGGGLTPRGTERGLRVHRRNADGKVEKIEVLQDALIRENDVLYVQETLF